MASLKEERRNRVLLTLATIRLATTEQIARLLFQESGSPAKRSSEMLREMELERIVEGRRMGSMKKVWRLSHKGRLLQNDTMTPTPLNTMKLNHFLAIGDIYTHLQKTGLLKYFEVELRERYLERVFSPDALFIWNKGMYLCEVQLARLSRNQWAQKWRMYNDYFNGRHFEQASWQKFGKGQFLKPRIVAITDQAPDVVNHGYEVEGRELSVIKSIGEMNI